MRPASLLLVLLALVTTAAATPTDPREDKRLDGDPVNPQNWLPACFC
jgi:hypothetical protein